MSLRALFSNDTEHTAVNIDSQGRYRILLVDDEPNVVASLRRVFRNENYDVLSALSGEEALGILDEMPIQVVISDFRMPGMHGGDLLRRVREKHPECIRMLLTGYGDTETVMGAIQDGAVYKFMLKPWNDDDLRVTVALALEQFELARKNRELESVNRKQSKDIAVLSRQSSVNRSQLAIMLHKKGLLSAGQLQKVYSDSRQKQISVLRYITDEAWVDERRIMALLTREFMFEEIDLTEIDLDPSVMALVPRGLCRTHAVIPLRVDGSQLHLAVADPMDSSLIESIGFGAGLTVHTSVAALSDIDRKLKTYFGDDTDIRDLATSVGGIDPYEAIQIVIDEEDDNSLEELLRGSDEPPAIRLVNGIILEALRLGASDIHIQPKAKSVSVRYRIDGVLREMLKIPSQLLMPLVSRIKVIAELDISERRKPQDGRITVKTSTRIVDLRISTLPTINGEKVVMRVLDRQSSVKRIGDLGLSPENQEALLDVITKPQGIILATGPTGSGKTTTLYTMLQHDASTEKNYVTIEDPVEFYVDMAGQVPVRERVGMDFATILRAILRQDPDVILLGEIRDVETAEVAFHAALTGHVVYSTLHTNSATATIARLLDLGLKPYIVASALEAIIAQRLLRRLCDHCKIEREADPATLRRLGEHFDGPCGPMYAACGCDRCNDGYRGRVPIHEVLVLNEEIRSAIVDGASAHQLYQLAQETGMKTLIHDAREKVLAGVTSAEEVLRVMGSQARPRT